MRSFPCLRMRELPPCGNSDKTSFFIRVRHAGKKYVLRAASGQSAYQPNSQRPNQTPGLRTAYEGDAQAVLQVAIVDYKLIPVATSEKDTALAASYKAQATAQCTLTRSNGEIIFKDKRVKADAMVYPYSNGENNLIGNQYQNMPVLMRELGNRIKDAVIGIW